MRLAVPVGMMRRGGMRNCFKPEAEGVADAPGSSG